MRRSVAAPLLTRDDAQRPAESRQTAPHRASLLLLGCLGLSQSFCNALVPEYRVLVTAIPSGTVQLQVATYVEGVLATDTPMLAVAGPRPSFTFGLNLGGALPGRATISVAARGADGCLLAVGIGDPTSPSATAADVEVPLAAPAEGTVNQDACRADPPVILTAIRQQQGPLQSLKFFLLLQGWGFQPTAQVTLTSTANVECSASADSTCLSACPVPCSGKDPSPRCRTSCPVTLLSDAVVHLGPSLIQVPLQPELNSLQQPSGSDTEQDQTQPIDLLLLMSQPLTVTVKNLDSPANEVTFRELGLPVTSPAR